MICRFIAMIYSKKVVLLNKKQEMTAQKQATHVQNKSTPPPKRAFGMLRKNLSC